LRFGQVLGADRRTIDLASHSAGDLGHSNGTFIIVRDWASIARSRDHSLEVDMAQTEAREEVVDALAGRQAAVRC
jgi:hypothetical protein